MITVGMHVADGPATGGGASGVYCGVANTGSPTHADWYSFSPFVDGLYTITSTNDPELTDTRLKLWDGNTGCDSLICINADDDNGDGFTSLLTECLSAGSLYYIEWDDRWSSDGFEWEITLDTAISCEPPHNDTCAAAMSVSIGSLTPGTNIFATDNDPPLCGTVMDSMSGGLWFSLMGNGMTLTASTCNPGTDFDTQLSVYTGDCGVLTCIDGNDDQPGPLDEACDVLNIFENRASTVEWSSEDGVIYFIYVSGWGTKTGFFELSVVDPDGLCPEIGTTHIVTNTLNDGTGSLRQVTENACPLDTITFDGSLAGDTIRLTGAEIQINKNLSIIGLGIDDLYVSGGSNSRIFDIHVTRELFLQSLTLKDGFAVSNGGALYNRGILTLEDLRLKDNMQGGISKALTNDNILIVSGGTVDIRK